MEGAGWRVYSQCGDETTENETEGIFRIPDGDKVREKKIENGGGYSPFGEEEEEVFVSFLIPGRENS